MPRGRSPPGGWHGPPPDDFHRMPERMHPRSRSRSRDRPQPSSRDRSPVGWPPRDASWPVRRGYGRDSSPAGRDFRGASPGRRSRSPRALYPGAQLASDRPSMAAPRSAPVSIQQPRSTAAPVYVMSSAIHPEIKLAIEDAYLAGKFGPKDILQSNVTSLLQMPVKIALEAVAEYARIDKSRVNHPAAFFTGVIRRIMEERGLPPPNPYQPVDQPSHVAVNARQELRPRQVSPQRPHTRQSPMQGRPDRSPQRQRQERSPQRMRERSPQQARQERSPPRRMERSPPHVAADLVRRVSGFSESVAAAARGANPDPGSRYASRNGDGQYPLPPPPDLDGKYPPPPPPAQMGLRMPPPPPLPATADANGGRAASQRSQPEPMVRVERRSAALALHPEPQIAAHRGPMRFDPYTGEPLNPEDRNLRAAAAADTARLYATSGVAAGSRDAEFGQAPLYADPSLRRPANGPLSGYDSPPRSSRAPGFGWPTEPIRGLDREARLALLALPYDLARLRELEEHRARELYRTYSPPRRGSPGARRGSPGLRRPHPLDMLPLPRRMSPPPFFQGPPRGPFLERLPFGPMGRGPSRRQSPPPCRSPPRSPPRSPHRSSRAPRTLVRAASGSARPVMKSVAVAAAGAAGGTEDTTRKRQRGDSRSSSPTAHERDKENQAERSGDGPAAAKKAASTADEDAAMLSEEGGDGGQHEDGEGGEPSMIDELLQEGDNINETWQGQDEDGDAFDMANLVDMKQVQQALAS